MTREGVVNDGADREAAPLVVARDAAYAPRGRTSFEFVTFEAAPGEVCALVGDSSTACRDLTLAVAGLVAPTAGSLVVDGVELAAPRRLGRARLPRLVAGVGVYQGVLDIDMNATVEACLRREWSLRVHAVPSQDEVLDHLASCGLATLVDQRVKALDAAQRARLSGALACAGGVKVASFDMGDPFVGQLAAADACALMRDMRRWAALTGACFVVAVRDAHVARAADNSVPLDMASAEALALEGGDAHAGVR